MLDAHADAMEGFVKDQTEGGKKGRKQMMLSLNYEFLLFSSLFQMIDSEDRIKSAESPLDALFF